ncbi:MAG: hypothetical protein IOD15_12675 [Phycisphaerales bacterium]|nr:hypothetical protein [Phycisphaerales bacterium]
MTTTHTAPARPTAIRLLGLAGLALALSAPSHAPSPALAEPAPDIDLAPIGEGRGGFDWEMVEEPMGRRGMGGMTGMGNLIGFGDGDGSRSGRAGDDPAERLTFSTPIGRLLQRMNLRRDPTSVIDARIRLARLARAAATLVGPPDPTDGLGAAATAGRSGAPSRGDMGELGDPTSPEGDGAEPGLAVPEGMVLPEGLSPEDLQSLPAGVRNLVPSLPGMPRRPATDPGASPGTPTDAIAALQRARDQAIVRATAERYRLAVIAGDWAAVRTFLTEQAGADAAAIYQWTLTQLLTGDSALVPTEVLAVADAWPETLTERHVLLLGQLLRNSGSRGGDITVVTPRIAAGTAHFGGPAEAPDSAAKRTRAASFLVAAGLTVEAQAYLPPLDQARATGDVELLNLYATAFDAQARRTDEPNERTARLTQAWQLSQEVLASPLASEAQRTAALSKVLRFIHSIDLAAGDAWLTELFSPANQPARTDLAWSVIRRVKNRCTALVQMQAPPEVRAKQLALVGRLGRAILSHGPQSAADWRSALNLLTASILEEAELSRSLAGMPNEEQYDPSMMYGRAMGGMGGMGGMMAMGGMRSSSMYGGYGGYGDGEQQRMRPIAADDLARLLPSEQWLLTIDPGLAAKLELLVATTQGGAGEIDAALNLIRPVAASDPARARALAEAVLKAWPTYTKRSPVSARSSRASMYNPYGGYGMYGGFGGMGGAGDGIPLTRALQQRHLAKLASTLAAFRDLRIDPLPVQLLIDAFAASHSSAEVYQPADIAAVFGPLDTLPVATRLKLADAMRQRLATMWRNQQVQQQAGTKRTEQQLAAEVVRGYAIALDLVPALEASAPEAWQALIAAADLNFDQAEYLYGRKADLATYTSLRDSAFSLYARAAAAYTTALGRPNAQPVARPFIQWFNAALGASDLGFLTRQDAQNTPQLAAVAQALAALPEAHRARHTELFAQAAARSLSELNPELKHRYARAAAELLGNHPAAAPIRATLAYYQDLLAEVQLNVAVDGPTSVGTQPFGLTASVWSTVAVSRESGGFAKYVTANGWNPMTGEQIDYRELFEKKAREALADRFEVLSVAFAKPEIRPTPIDSPLAGNREGWEQTPIAYLVLKAKDPAVDAIPALSLDMDFRDSGGMVILPIASGPLAISAASPPPAAPAPISDLKVEFILDDRAFAGPASPNAPADENAPTRGTVTLEVKASGAGLIPDLPALADLGSIPGFTVHKVQDNGIVFADLLAAKGRAVALTERSWSVTLLAQGRPSTFRFPALRVSAGEPLVAPPEPKPGEAPAPPTPLPVLRRYADADLVPAEPTVALASLPGPGWPIWTGLTVMLVTLAGLMWAMTRRRAVAPAAAPRFTLPASINPVTTIDLLRRIATDGGPALPPAARQDLLVEIKSLEERYFAPGANGQPAPADEGGLRSTLAGWIQRAG